MTVPDAPVVPDRSTAPASRSNERDRAVGVIADAIRNVRRLPLEQFSNPQGGQQPDFGHSIQFDTKGVDFGWWVARFLNQVRSNWIPIIPQAIMSMHGNAAIGFIVHKDGRITDITVVRPSAVHGFTLAAHNAMKMSNPTLALPAEYPDDRMPVIVTFYYNEEPSGR